MSKIFTPDYLDEDQNPSNTANNGSSEVSSAPEAPGTAGSVPSTSSLANPTSRKSSSGFTNLKQYIQANQNNNLANTVTSEAQNKLNSSQQNLQSSEDQFRQSLEGEKAKVQGVAGEANKALNYIGTGAQPLTSEVAPTTVAKPMAAPLDSSAKDYLTQLDSYNKQKSDYDAYQANLNAYNQKANDAALHNLSALKSYNYSGPTALANADQLAGNQAEINDFANATGSESGRGAILQTLFGKGGNYTAGTRNFDNLLLGSNQSNLDKLKAIRAQSSAFGQNLNQAANQALGSANTAKGDVNTIKSQNANAMKALRDSLYTDLNSQANAYNTKSNADAAAITSEELNKLLPQVGYDLTSPIIHPKNSNSPDVLAMRNATGLQLPISNSSGSQITLPVEGAPGQGEDYINLYQNRNFAPEDIVDPNQTYTRNISNPSGFFGGGGGSSSSTGKPNNQQIYVNKSSLTPLFNQSYGGNDWQSINAEELNRRNVLSQVLADNAENGLATAKNKNEVETGINQDLLEKLKQTPKMIQDQYTKDILSGTPATEGLNAVKNYKALGYENPLELMKDLGFENNNTLNGTPKSATWNPTTKTIHAYTLANGWKNYLPDDYLKAISTPRVHWNDSKSPALVADALKKISTVNRLKSLGIADPQIDWGS